MFLQYLIYARQATSYIFQTFQPVLILHARLKQTNKTSKSHLNIMNWALETYMYAPTTVPWNLKKAYMKFCLYLVSVVLWCGIGAKFSRIELLVNYMLSEWGDIPNLVHLCGVALKQAFPWGECGKYLCLA